MKCMNCGAEIPEGKLRCAECGREVQIVPDYNPLDDVLAAQVKDELMKHTQAMDVEQINAMRRGNQRMERDDKTVRMSQEDLHRITSEARERRRTEPETSNRNQRRVSQTSRNLRQDATDEQEERRRQAARKRQAIKKKKKKRMMILGSMAALLIIILVIVYQFSYNGYVRKGNKALAASDYTTAEDYFGRAISKNDRKPDAYTGQAKVYVHDNKQQDAENLFLDAIKKYPKDTDLYRACIQFYYDTKQEASISELLDKCKNDAVLTNLKEYASEAPTFSLEETKFDDVQELSISGKGTAIYYTIDGSEPTTSSTKYTDAIQIKEGETTVRAISVSKKGVPSLETSKTYTVEIPVEAAPSVSPSTGQYSSAQTIEVTVPDGYTAYYTTDGTTPTSSSKKYKKPIAMPEGNTLFSVILINGKGHESGITKRNYELITE